MGLNESLERIALELNEMVGTLRVAMDDGANLEARVTNLEETIDEMKDTIDRLQEVVIEQTHIINELKEKNE